MAYGEFLPRLSPCKNERIANILRQYAPDFTALCDIGCGRGERLGFLSGVFPDAKFTGIDTDEENLEISRKNAPCARIFQTDACDTGLPTASFDVLLCECVFSLFDRPEAFSTEARRLLKPGGILLLGDLYAKNSPAGCFSLEHHEIVNHIYGKDIPEKLMELPCAAFTDCSRELTEMLAQMVMDGTLCSCFNYTELKQLKALSTGYGLWVFRYE